MAQSMDLQRYGQKHGNSRSINPPSFEGRFDRAYMAKIWYLATTKLEFKSSY
jgi:hypothetical protein